MKFLAVFAVVVAVAAGYPAVSSWTLPQLAQAIQDPNTDPAQLPYLEAALNELMNNLHAGEQLTPITVSMPVQSTVTLDELTTAVHDPSTNPALLPYYEDALHELMVAINNGQQEEAIVLSIPAMQVNSWSLQQLSEAVQNPETDPELMVYLEYALNELMTALYSGHQIESIAVITPPGVMATPPAPAVVPEPVIVIPMPVVVPEPVIVAPEPVVVPEVVAPGPAVIPEAVSPPAAPSSPLVQLIININQGSQVARALA